LEALFRTRGLDIAQELKTCFIGRLDREEVSFLKSAGVPVTLLDRDITGKTYYLVRPDSDRTSGVMSGKGKVAVLEPGQLLFWTPSGDGAGAIPASLARKRLAASSIVPYMRSYPAPAVTTAAVARDPLIGAIADSVSRENLRALIKSLQDFGTRRTGTPGCDAAETFVVNYFYKQGLRAFVTSGALNGARSAVGELKGTNFPDDIVIVCAHLDSTSPEPDTLAPGADDDASGTAAVMETARVLARHPTDYTVRFIAFTGEEQGLYGSQAYSIAARDLKERIVGVVNLDMIAYADRMPEDLDVFVNSASEWMGYRIAQDAGEYAGLSVKTRVDPSMVYSDHASFWDNGYAALLAIEDEPIRNPYYHTTGDTLDTLNLDFCAQATRAALATTAILAQPVRLGPSPPLRLQAQSSFFSALLGTRKNVYLRWEREADNSSFNIYRTEIPHGFYQRVNEQLVRGTTYADRGVASGVAYYYAITAIDQAGVESNLSREVEVLPLPPKQTLN
ncbi:MAG TPA: M28 family peptidase, partial [Acidobacteriota bacterium]|nr:M28 family peptidase [Acidobacteriota bacterium]